MSLSIEGRREIPARHVYQIVISAYSVTSVTAADFR